MLGEEWEDSLTDEFMAYADLDKSGSLSLDEFTKFCETALLGESSKDLVYINQMIKGFLAMIKRRQDQAQAMWRYYAVCIDEVARYTVPPLYVLFLIVVVSLDYGKVFQEEQP